MKWTMLRSLAQAHSIYWAFGLWIPVITGILIARAGTIAVRYPKILLIDYPDILLSAILLAFAGTLWAIFGALCQVLPYDAIRDHKSQAEYLEKRNKSYSGEDWPEIFTEIVKNWEEKNRLSPKECLAAAFLLMTVSILIVFALARLLAALRPFLISVNT